MRILNADMSAALAGAVVLTGVQGITPALPALTHDLGLSEIQLSLLIVGYLVPGALFAYPAGVLADLIGLNRVTAAALAVFGAGGILAFFCDDFTQLLVVRGVQGAMFGGILALTIASIAHSASEGSATSAQSKRVVIMMLAEVIAPLASGIIVEAVSWNAAFLLQALALPVAVLCHRVLPRRVEGDGPRSSTAQIVRTSRRAVFSASGLAVQLPGFLRFFLKYALLTFAPILASGAYGLGAFEVGLMLALAALGGMSAAAAAPRLARTVSVGRLLALSLTVTALPIVSMPAAGIAPVFFALVIISGTGDGLLAVVNNVVITRLAPSVGSSAFIGLTGGIRSAGKLSAPILAGLLAGSLPLALVIGAFGVMGLAALAVVPRVSRLLSDVDGRGDDEEAAAG